MSDLTDPIAARREKLARIRQAGVDPYPPQFARTHRAAEILEGFAQLEEGELVAVAGRLHSLRLMGKAAFGHIEDSSGRIQVYLRRDLLGDEAYALLKLIDLSDFLGIRGRVFRTRMGEISVRAEQLEVLAKSLRPMPVVKDRDGTVFDTFRDRETRYRQRYLDLMVNPETRELFRRRSNTIVALRRELDRRGFLEVETPVLQLVYGGALARPFQTHHNALDLDLYLRIAEELPLKKLIVGGLERVYEIGRVFRNEGLDRHHNPEFTMLEFYWAYADYRDAMDLVEELLRAVARDVCGGLSLSSGTATIDLGPPFARRPMMSLIREATGEEVLGREAGDLQAICRRLGAKMHPTTSPGKLIEKIFDLAVVPNLEQPTFVIDHPKLVSPLAKAHREDPEHLVERFELFVGGQELANAFTELNDPDEQRRRFEQQTRLRDGGDEETHPLDEDFLAALEHGMPPTAGVGIGVDRLVMLLTGAQAIRDVLLFPHMRPLLAGESDADARGGNAEGQDGEA